MKVLFLINQLGRDIALRWSIVSIALVMVLSLISSSSQNAQAHGEAVDFGVLVWIDKVDAKNWSGETADFYNVTRLYDHDNSGYYDEACQSGTSDDHNHIEPYWGCEKGITSGQLINRIVPLAIELYDNDTPWSNSDQVDINPDPKIKELHLAIRFTDPDSPTQGGFLFNEETGEPLAVFRPGSPIYGLNSSWESMPIQDSLPGQPNYGASLVSEGDHGDEQARIEYSVVILREPDFALTKVILGNNATEVHVVNLGGPGVLEQVNCTETRRVRHINIEMAPYSSTIVKVPIAGCGDYTVIGRNWFGGREPHSDNNALRAP